MNAKIGKNRATARKKQGIWVFRTEGTLKASVVRETIEIVRKEREQQVSGRMRNPRNEAQLQFRNLCHTSDRTRVLRSQVPRYRNFSGVR